MPRSRRALAASPMFAAALILTLALPTAVASPKAAGGNSEQHCVTILARAPVGQDSVVVDSRCFATFAEGFEYASAGAIEVPADLQAGDVTQTMAANASASGAPYLLGTYWDAQWYFSWSWSWWASSGCTPTSGWQVSYVGSDQNDRYESSKSYSGCNQNRHFEHSNFLGASLLCTPNCGTLGVMNNNTSSLRWWG